MCDRISCGHEPAHTTPTMFETETHLCGKCYHEWRTIAYNLHMNFMGLLEFEQRAFLGQARSPEEIEISPTEPPPPIPIKAQDEEYFRNESTKPETPESKKADGGEQVEILYC